MRAIHEIRSWVIYFKRYLLPFMITAAFITAVQAQSSGVIATAPIIKVGDRWKYETTDRRTGAKENEFDQRVTSVSASQIEGSENDGKFLWTSELNLIESPTVLISGEVKRLSFPLEVGKKWEYKYSFSSKVTGVKGRQQLEATVVGYEKVKVTSGEYDAFKIEYKGFWNNDTTGRNGRLKITSWFAPSVRSTVKTEFDDGYNNRVTQLVEVQIQP